MPQHFFCALALTVTLTTNLTPMTRDNDHRDGSKLTLPRFDPKDPTFFDDLQAYAQDRGLGWLLHADGEDTNDISKYEDMQSDTYKNLKTTGDNATDDDKDKARRWIHDSSVLAGILRRSTHRNPLGRNIIKRALKRDNTDGVHALKKLYEKYSPEAQSAAIQIQFDAYAQRGCPLDEFIATFDDYITALEAGANITEKYKINQFLIKVDPALKSHVISLTSAAAEGCEYDFVIEELTRLHTATELHELAEKHAAGLYAKAYGANHGDNNTNDRTTDTGGDKCSVCHKKGHTAVSDLL